MDVSLQPYSISMLAFATELPVAAGATSIGFLAAFQKWILGSPHSGLTARDFATFTTDPKTRIDQDSEIVEAIQVGSDGDRTAAARYTKRGGGLEWITTAIFSQHGNTPWIGIRLSCEASLPAARLPAVKKPVLVRTLLSDLGGGFDGALKVGSTPYRLHDTEIELAARLMSGGAGCHLPVVYVSARFLGGHVVDTERLASDLSGMAHVVVEPNRPFSLRLQVDVRSHNVYGGSVGVYWPEGAGRRAFFLGRDYESSEQLAGAIVDEVRTALANRRSLDTCTWAYAQEKAARLEMESLRSMGSTEVSRYIETFDSERRAAKETLKEAKDEIARLKRDMEILERRSSREAGNALAIDEQELYPDEARCVLREALLDAITRVPADSRRLHLLRSMVNAVGATDDIPQQRREELKALLRGYKRMDANTKRGLEALGFSLSEDGKHIKLVFQGDERYTFTLPKSGSDGRGGLNAASDISRLLF